MSIMNGFLLLMAALLVSAANATERDGNFPYALNGRITIQSFNLAKCMAGAVSKPSSRFNFAPLTEYPNAFNPDRKCKFSKNEMFRYLMAAGNRCDYSTGNEPRLKYWIQSQPDNSIGILEIFQQSLKINNGQVFNAVLTIHQLLRNEARWWSTGYYYYKSSNEEAAKFWAKFIDIRGDLSELGGANEGDHRGSWYRIWGSMLNRLMNECPDADSSTCVPVVRQGFDKFVTDAGANLSGLLAELVKFPMDLIPTPYKPGGDRAGKSRINVTGAYAANDMLHAFDSGDSIPPGDERCSHEKLYFRQGFYSDQVPADTQNQSAEDALK